MRAFFAFSLALLVGLAGACSEPEEEDAPVPASEAVAPVPASEAVAPGAAAGGAVDDLAADDEEELELGEGLDDEEEPIPLDQMDEAMLETACFEGRQDACDRLGH